MEEHEGVVQNGELEIAGFSEKYNPTTRLKGVKTQKVITWNLRYAEAYCILNVLLISCGMCVM